MYRQVHPFQPLFFKNCIYKLDLTYCRCYYEANQAVNPKKRRVKRMAQIDDLLSRFKAVSDGQAVSMPNDHFNSYAITNFRGGIGKSTLAFNLAWEISRTNNLLALDVCPQTNFTQSLLGSDRFSPYTIYDALLPLVMPGTETIKVSDLITSVPVYCDSFKKG